MLAVIDRLTAPSRAPWLIGAVAVACLIGAVVLEYGFGVAPCVLCLWQRVPWALALALAVAGVSPLGRGWALPWLLAVVGTGFLAGTGVAVFHIGIQNHWWAGTPACGVPALATTIEDLRAQLLAQPVVRCDEVNWSLFGLSLPVYNALLSLPLALLALVAARRAAAR
ncbi:protein dithiol:quinone oxidoreductase [uncultured Gammaproteobacteria bacterium]